MEIDSNPWKSTQILQNPPDRLGIAGFCWQVVQISWIPSESSNINQNSYLSTKLNFVQKSWILYKLECVDYHCTKIQIISNLITSSPPTVIRRRPTLVRRGTHESRRIVLPREEAQKTWRPPRSWLIRPKPTKSPRVVISSNCNEYKAARKWPKFGLCICARKPHHEQLYSDPGYTIFNSATWLANDHGAKKLTVALLPMLVRGIRIFRIRIYWH